MDPVAKWALIAGGVGALGGSLVSYFAYKQVTGFFRKGLLLPPVFCAAGFASVTFVGLSVARDVLAPTAPTPEQFCASAAPKGQTAVFERRADGGFSCSYKPL
jgi:hypothetical protein